MCDPLAFDGSARITPFPIAHIPPVCDSDYGSVLFSVSHLSSSFFVLARLLSRAATANFAIRLSSATDNFAALAFPPFLAILATSASDKFCARARPPSRPSACAFEFFF
jgi:hypothetical protein